ncbi:hypothetical protein C8J56DRAFT_486454 [Mycena floridula]|nr:hypothetical protein C8J56DRAFT_486454 [Mycena floridula]
MFNFFRAPTLNDTLRTLLYLSLCLSLLVFVVSLSTLGASSLWLLPVAAFGNIAQHITIILLSQKQSKCVAALLPPTSTLLGVLSGYCLLVLWMAGLALDIHSSVVAFENSSNSLGTQIWMGVELFLGVAATILSGVLAVACHRERMQGGNMQNNDRGRDRINLLV